MSDRDRAHDILTAMIGAKLTVQFMQWETCEQNHPEAMVYHPDAHLVTVTKEVTLREYELPRE